MTIFFINLISLGFTPRKAGDRSVKRLARSFYRAVGLLTIRRGNNGLKPASFHRR
jgi:hypothetical protein